MAENVTFPRKILFEKWDPGQELKQDIVVRNVGLYPLTISHSTTSTPEFQVPFPVKVKLFTGNTFRFPVTFQPTKKQRYSDEISLLVGGTKHAIVLQGNLSRISVSLDKCRITFEEQPCGTEIRHSAVVANHGERPVAFSWSVEPPFSVVPSTGTLAPSETMTVIVTFLTGDIAEYQRTATLTCRDQVETQTFTILLSARSRCASYVLFRPSPESQGCITVEFPSLVLGSITTRCFSMCSTLMSDVPFTLMRKEDPSTGSSQVYSFDAPVGAGVLRPNSWTDLPLNFVAQFVASAVAETFTLQWGLENSSIDIRCTGQTEGPAVKTSSKLLDFGCVFVEEQRTLVFTLQNDGECDTYFELDSDENCALFTVIPKVGEITHGSRVAVRVTFAPKWPGMFRAVLPCIVQAQGVIFVHAIATCHSSTTTPLILTPRHLDIYSADHMAFFLRRGPRAVKEMVECGRLVVRCGLLQLPNCDVDICVQQDQNATTNDPSQDVGHINDWNVGTWLRDARTGDCDESPREDPVELDKNEILFGFAASSTVIAKTVHLRNNTEEPVTVRWTEDKTGIFTVSPESATVVSREHMDFTIRFRPNSTGTFLDCHLECHVMFAYLMDFQLHESYQVIPPWTLRLHVSGHSVTWQEQILLRPSLEPHFKSAVVFRDFLESGFSFHTLLLQNPTSNVVMFKVGKPKESGIWIKPRFGTLMPGGSKSVVVGVEVAQKKLLQTSLSMQLNDNDAVTQEIPLLAYFNPDVILTFPPQLAFPDTFPGQSSTLPLRISSDADAPVRIGWLLTKATGTFLTITPASRDIAPHDWTVFQCVFVPAEARSYSAEVYFSVCAVNRAKQVHKVTFAGTGVVGHISSGCSRTLADDLLEGSDLWHPRDDVYVDLNFAKEEHRFDNECVNVPATYTFPVHNKNHFAIECTLKTEVFPPDGSIAAQDTNTEHGAGDHVKGEHPQFSMTQSRFLLPPNTHENVNMTFCPLSAGWTTILFYSKPILSGASDHAEPLLIATVKVFASLPKLQIVDLVGCGSADVLGKSRLYHMMEIERLNQLLDKPSNYTEKIQECIEYGASNVPYVKPGTDKMVVDLGTAPKDVPCSVRLLLHNPTPVVVSWRVVFMDQLVIKVDKNIPGDDTPKDYKNLRSSKLLEVTPRKGQIAAGATGFIDLHCSHHQPGRHILPMFLQIMNGKILFLQIAAQTLQPGEGKLETFRSRIQFPDTIPTSLQPQRQELEIFNPSDVEMSYHIKNSDGEVFQCPEPSGKLRAKSFVRVPVLFRPAQIRDYQAIVHLSAGAGDKKEIVLLGTGCSAPLLLKKLNAALVTRNDCISTQILFESSVLRFSDTVIRFDCVPLFTVNRRICFLTNSSKQIMRFKWKASCSRCISIEAQFGTIHPGASRLVTVTYQPGSETASFEESFTLEFGADDEIRRYRCWLQKWVAEVKERCRDFVNTEANPTADQDVAQALQYIAYLDEMDTEVTETRLNDFTKSFQSLLMMLRTRQDVTVPPLMEEPRLHRIHLIVTGRSIDEELFKKLHPGQFENFQLDVPATPTVAPLSFPISEDVEQEVRLLTSTILGEAVGSVLGEAFKDDLTEALKQPSNLLYADMFAVSEDDEEEADDDVGCIPARNSKATKGASSGVTGIDSAGVQRKDGVTEISAVSPRSAILRRLPVEETDQTDSMESFLNKLENAEEPDDVAELVQDRFEATSSTFLDGTFARMSQEILHALVSTVIEEARNSSFDLFGDPKLLMDHADT